MIRRLSLLLMLVAALGLAACGQEANEEGEYQSESAQLAETEGIYVDVDELKYQVQVSK
jgi:ABC-type glycerol-3-phosphate transport system substrate-binding protein